MYDFDVYLSDMKGYDSANLNKTDWFYYLPDSLQNKLSEHEKWLIKCDYVSLSSNISTTDGCSITMHNTGTDTAYKIRLRPGIENSITEMVEVINNFLKQNEVLKLCGTTSKIFTLSFDQETHRMKMGKSQAVPPVELRDVLFISLNKRLGEKLGFKTKKAGSDQVIFAYSRLFENRPYFGDNYPNILKYFRRFYLVGDFVRLSILNSNQYGIICSFNNPYYFDPKNGRVEIDRSQNDHWIDLVNKKTWRIRLANELMETLSVVTEHDIHLKFRLKPAPIF